MSNFDPFTPNPAPTFMPTPGLHYQHYPIPPNFPQAQAQAQAQAQNQSTPLDFLFLGDAASNSNSPLPSSPVPHTTPPPTSTPTPPTPTQNTTPSNVLPPAAPLSLASAYGTPANAVTVPQDQGGLNVQGLQVGRILQMLEVLTSTTSQVLHRVEGLEGRLTSLEGSVKEILTHQRSLQMQLKDSEPAAPANWKKNATPPPATSVPSPILPQPQVVNAYGAPAPPFLSYPAPVPVGMMGMQMHPQPIPTLVPVTHIREEDPCQADMEIARRLQASFDSESPAPSPKPSMPKVTPKSTNLQECPICSLKFPIDELKSHVDAHFEEDLADSPPVIRGGKKDDKAPPGFFSKLFTSTPKVDEKDKDKDKPATTATPASTPAPASTSSSSNTTSKPASTTSTSPSSTGTGGTFNQNFRPNTPQYPSYPNGMYRPSNNNPPGYYPYPGTMQPPQQYMYYPQIDGHPQ